MQSRILAMIWLVMATTILICTYATLPRVAAKTFSTIEGAESQKIDSSLPARSEESANSSKTHTQFYALGTIALGLAAVGFSCFLLGRAAFVEIELAARYGGIADALCLGCTTTLELEKAVNILVPAARYLSVPDIFSVNDLKSVFEIVGQLKPTK
jgi:hypothetical protein